MERVASDREQRLPVLSLRYMKCHHPLTLWLLEEALVGQEVWWHQNFLHCFGQQPGPAEGTPFVGYIQHANATPCTLLFHKNCKDMDQDRM